MERLFKNFLVLLIALVMAGCASGGGEEDGDDFLDEIPTEEESEADLVPDEGDELLDEEEVASDEVNEEFQESQIEPSEAVAPVGGDFTSYTVQSGDTLMKIAFDHYADVYRWRQIYNDNQGIVADFNNVPPGTTLQLRNPVNSESINRNGEQYLIVAGDTLGKISSKVYGTPSHWRAIWDNNRQLIKDPNKIYAGFYLYYLPADQIGAPAGNSLASTDAGPGPASLGADSASPGPAPATSAPAQPQADLGSDDLLLSSDELEELGG